MTVQCVCVVSCEDICVMGCVLCAVHVLSVFCMCVVECVWSAVCVVCGVFVRLCGWVCCSICGVCSLWCVHVGGEGVWYVCESVCVCML